MKNLKFLTAIFFAGLILAVSAFAQDTNATPEPQATPQQTRAGLLQELGLTPDQVREIRRANQERKPQMEAAQKRLREANRRLDEAIYSDQPNEADIQNLVKEAQEAQADVIRIRSTNELAIRRILTPDQVGKFRGLRQRFEEARQNIEQRRRERLLNNKQRKDPAAMPLRDGAKRLRPLVRQNAPKQ